MIKNTKPKSLIDHLNTIGGVQKARGYRPLHASALTYESKPFCAREIALCDLLDRPMKDEYINSTLQATFDVGWMMHHLVTDRWLKDIAVGRWKCPACGTHSPFDHYPEVCKECGNKHGFNYVEEVFIHPKLEVSGSIDILVHLQGDQLEAVEIKSIDKDEFRDLVAPKAEHRVRSQLYLCLIEESNSPVKKLVNIDHARILYVSKGYGAKGSDGKVSPFKEFVVPYDYDSSEPYLNMAQRVQDWYQEGIMPPRICHNTAVPRVKQCACPKECFSGKYH